MTLLPRPRATALPTLPARLGHAALFVLLLAAPSCGDGITPQPAPGTVTVEPATLELTVGASTRLQARATDAGGAPQPATDFTWSTSDASVAAVDPDGTVRAKAVGEATVTAESERRTGSARVVVRDVSTGDPAMAWFEMTPRAVDPTRDDSATYTLATEGAVTSAAIVRGGQPDILLRADGPNRWTARIAVADLARGYQRGWTHNYVGQLTFNGARGGGYVVSANVRDGDMPDVPVRALAADAQSSPRVFNLRWDDLYLGRAVPRSVIQRFYQHFGDDYDWIATVEPVSSPHNRFFGHVRSAVDGIGVARLDVGADYGSSARLKGLIHFPLDSYFDMGYTAASHEIGHQWINFLRLDPTLARGVPHWPISTLAYGVMGWTISGGAGGSFPYRLDPLGDGRYRVTRVGEAKDFNSMELYLMGLLPADSVGDFLLFEDQDQLSEVRDGGTLRGPVRTLRVSDVVALHGPRAPAYPQAQKDFRLAVIVLSRGRLLTAAEMAYFDHLAARGEATTELPFAQGLVYGTAKPFGPATGGRARLTTRLQ